MEGTPVSAPTTADNVLELIAPSPRVTGSIFRAPLGTTLPTTSYADLDAGFTDLGYADESGIKQKEARTSTDQFAWGGALIGSLQEKYSRTLSLKLLQFVNKDVLAAGFGNANVSTTPATSQHGTEIAVKLNPNLLDTMSWVFDGFYLQRLVRIVVPIGRVNEIGDVDLTNKAYTTIDITKLMAYPDSNGNHGYLYLNDGATTGGS